MRINRIAANLSPFREIIDYTFVQGKYSKFGYGSVRIKLTCGHIQWRKLSQSPKGNRVRCKDCRKEDAENG